ncbi:bifunctional diaminohydroxyphosphoribosylaminopyrimidine deaminase/5-amino-6-(5-phosphoribosylamino)uracil reductase RibD [Rhodobacter sp. NSM]|uniref:bifunctional diaminohydroxyphosphoribosylaminopyrimidine deaminase/5-amino-6-(5-phosphoribosylamino)uracil reductase RibD n=1 Tax=Rhodobacter sp. NSM TaxID=3457501 RepID=UPI003FD3286E
MAHALRLGARGLGRTWPNPAVGCVVVKAGRVVGRGWTRPGGRPHAEPVALAAAGTAALGATAYVTLEPCAHHGRTPPCAEALVAAGIARVVTATGDPDPRVSGRGHALLRAAGILVTEGVLEAEARSANAGFLKRVTQGLPFVTLKLASTVDGSIATASGESRWITGTLARRAAHAMRMRHDAVMVGVGTALADDPDLSVRDLGARHQPVRIVVDRLLRHAPDSRLGRTARQVPVWLCHGADAPEQAREGWRAAGAILLECAAGPDGLDVRSVMQRLAAEGLTRIFCEGGARLGAALVRAGLCDELISFTAGKLIGEEGRGAMGPLRLLHLADAPAFGLVSVETVGVDLLARWRPL